MLLKNIAMKQKNGFMPGIGIKGFAGLILFFSGIFLAAANTPDNDEHETAVDKPVETADSEKRDSVPRILRADLNGVVSPGSAGYLMDAVSAAASGDYDACLIVLDTPGGLLEATREISRSFLEAEVPVIVYVAPTGARAASAGLFVTISAHVAAMAPGTRIGAAAPVALGGDSEDSSKTMDKKVIEDTAAFVRSVAEHTGRNPEWAEKAVRDAVSATDSEALKLGVIDLIADSVENLLEKADGRIIKMHGGEERTLNTRGAVITEHPMTIQQRVLMVLGDPNVAYVLMMLGLLGLMMELYNPGLIFPAAIGLFLLLLAGIGLNLLPVNIGGVILIVIALGLIVSEIYVTAYGILAVIGLGIMALGSALLMDTADPDFFVDPDITVSWGVILPTMILVALVSLALVIFIIRVHSMKGNTGHEGMKGEYGTARTEINNGGGRVFVHGELWNAVSEKNIPANAKVRVVEIDGLQLKVEAIDAPDSAMVEPQGS